MQQNLLHLRHKTHSCQKSIKPTAGNSHAPQHTTCDPHAGLDAKYTVLQTISSVAKMATILSARAGKIMQALGPLSKVKPLKQIHVFAQVCHVG